MQDGADAELVRTFVAGADESAFRSLYRRHTPALLGLAARLLGRRGRDAEDIVQEAWTRAASGMASFGWASSLRTWLSGFVVNVWHEAARSREHGALPELPEISEAKAFSGVERIDLERAIEALPCGFREVLLLHDVEGLTHEEIASALGIEPGTSKSQLSRARRAVRARLSEPTRRRS